MEIIGKYFEESRYLSSSFVDLASTGRFSRQTARPSSLKACRASLTSFV